MAENHRSASRESRRELIAQGAFEVLCDRGSHGVTHRAVDTQLSLPTGSTSYYFRTRVKLLCAALDHLYRLDKADLSEFKDANGELNVAELVVYWRSPPLRPRLLARLDLFLEAARHSELQQYLREKRAFFINEARIAMERTGEADPIQAADRALAQIEGELLREAVFGA